MLHLRRSNPECQRAKRAVRPGVAVAANNRHPRLRQPQLRTNHMHNPLIRRIHIEQPDAKFLAIRLQSPDLLGRNQIRNRSATRLSRNIVIDGSHRPRRLTNFPPRGAQPIKSLRRSHLMHQMQIDIQNRRPTAGCATRWASQIFSNTVRFADIVAIIISDRTISLCGDEQALGCPVERSSTICNSPRAPTPYNHLNAEKNILDGLHGARLVSRLRAPFLVGPRRHHPYPLPLMVDRLPQRLVLARPRDRAATPTIPVPHTSRTRPSDTAQRAPSTAPCDSAIHVR